jgi:hypothetical protein
MCRGASPVTRSQHHAGTINFVPSPGEHSKAAERLKHAHEN